MADPTTKKKQYDTFAPTYLSIQDLPCFKIEASLILTALGDCTGLHVLDLGGGNGLHARRAVHSASAASVDVVDISREMLRVGADIELSKTNETGGAPSRIRWLEADLSRSLSEQTVTPLDGGAATLRPDGYDIVMANWLFDHATCTADLRAMYANVASHLKPHGGRFIGVRVCETMFTAGYINNGNGKYGALVKDVERMDDGEPGHRYQVGMQLGKDRPAFYFGATSMDETVMLRDGEEGGIGRELGMGEYWVVPPAESDVVKADEEYWGDFVKEPNLAVVVAKKL